VKTLVVLNDPAYGTERSYNGLRLAHSLAKRDGEEVRIFLLADAVSCAAARAGDDSDLAEVVVGAHAGELPVALHAGDAVCEDDDLQAPRRPPREPPAFEVAPGSHDHARPGDT
jgi:sulfur relay (sulfurtransferase) complex TusBCD TusD component (DsrE family)